MALLPRRPRNGHASDKSVIPEIRYDTARCQLTDQGGRPTTCDHPAAWLRIFLCCNQSARFCRPHQSATEAWEMRAKATRDGIRCAHCGARNISPRWVQI